MGTRSRSAMLPDGRRTRCAGSCWGHPTTPQEVEKRKIDVQSAGNRKDQEWDESAVVGAWSPLNFGGEIRPRLLDCSVAEQDPERSSNFHCSR